MTEQQSLPRFIGCEMGDGNTADIAFVDLYSGDGHVVCYPHCFELMNAAAKVFLAPDDPEISQAVAYAGDMTQPEVSGSYAVAQSHGRSEPNAEDSFELNEM